MPSFWEYLGRSQCGDRVDPPPHHNLQEGLFQIATQTCSLLVQVNNTNNISYGDNATNIQCTSFHSASASTTSRATLARSDSLKSTASGGSSAPRAAAVDHEQLMVLIPPRNDKFNGFGKYRHRLSTVLESGGPEAEDLDNWNQGYMPRGDPDDGPINRWNKKGWCKPSCIPITIILILIFLVVLLPLLDHAMEEDNRLLNIAQKALYSDCPQSCRMSLIESIPEGLEYPNGSITLPSTFDTWLDLIKNAEKSIEIASFYWTLRRSEVYPDPSSEQGEQIFLALLDAGLKRKVSIKIAQNAPTSEQPNIDTEFLVKRNAAEVRSLNFAKLLGGGVLHTKLWLIDRKHFYVGSANMDWRALTQVKEMGAVVYNCSCLGDDVSKIFDVYWNLGEKDAKVPDRWPIQLSTKYNANNPMNLTLNNYNLQMYLSSSPSPFCPEGRTADIEAVLDVISRAEKFVYIAVMDYFPLTIYSPRIKYWPIIDDALRQVAIDHRVKVKLLISYWKHSRPSEEQFLRSLAVLTETYHGVQIEVKRFIVPASEDQAKIPFGRVNHNKYMVTDNVAYIGTSNWSGDYFIDTAGVGLVVQDPMLGRNLSEPTVRAQLQAVFERDWTSPYSHALPL